MAAAALSDGFDELMWIDSDVAFDADAVDRLRGHGLPIVCGVYARKGLRALACHVLPGTTRLVFGVEGGLTEVLYSGMGFMLVQRHVFLELQERLRLPVCNQRFACRSIPFFQPMIIPDGENHWYLPEDYAFCERARQCGYPIMADTTIRLWHHGGYGFSWEDAGKDKERYETFYFNLE
jgi:hypothetical protein